jgi:hypothetical protein
MHTDGDELSYASVDKLFGHCYEQTTRSKGPAVRCYSGPGNEGGTSGYLVCISTLQPACTGSSGAKDATKSLAKTAATHAWREHGGPKSCPRSGQALTPGRPANAARAGPTFSHHSSPSPFSSLRSGAATTGLFICSLYPATREHWELRSSPGRQAGARSWAPATFRSHPR